MASLSNEQIGCTTDPSFIALACSWVRDPSKQFLGFVWQAYDNMKEAPPPIDCRDLERSISQLLEPRIKQTMTGYEPFYVQHGSFERETMKPPPAQPPEYDLAFVLRADERIMWPLEAKVLETPNQVAKYEREIKNEFLTCRYAPFSNSGAMLGYLLTGSPSDTLNQIEKKLATTLKQSDVFPDRPHQISSHTREVPANKDYPKNFQCHHLILEYRGLKRASKS